jgi:hypothetical protein
MFPPDETQIQDRHNKSRRSSHCTSFSAFFSKFGLPLTVLRSNDVICNQVIHKFVLWSILAHIIPSFQQQQINEKLAALQSNMPVSASFLTSYMQV